MAYFEKLFNVIEENQHFKESSYRTFKLTTIDMFTVYQKSCWALSFLLNLVILFTYRLSEVPDGDRDLGERRLQREGFELGVNIASFILSGLSFVFFVFWLVFKSGITQRIAVKQYLRKRNLVDDQSLELSRRAKIFWLENFLGNKYALSFLLHAVFGILGPLVDPFFHTLHLLLYIRISESAMYIINSWTKRIGLIANTFLVALFVLYSYSTLAANYYSDKFDLEDIDVCSSLASCFLYTITLGLRNGGGLGDAMKPYQFQEDPKFASKLIFDISFFIFINIITLNIVFGVIIDTFGDMRDEAYQRQEYLESTCLVCLNQREAIESNGGKFKKHTEVLHNIWDYLDFAAQVRNKDRRMLSYVEEHAQNSILQKSADWMPLKSTIHIDTEEEEESDFLGKLSW